MARVLRHAEVRSSVLPSPVQDWAGISAEYRPGNVSYVSSFPPQDGRCTISTTVFARQLGGTLSSQPGSKRSVQSVDVPACTPVRTASLWLRKTSVRPSGENRGEKALA